ncbi:MAG: hypothetical protein AMXMBFR4_06980 [Candidatus Hydrogenedentota bacterium]
MGRRAENGALNARIEHGIEIAHRAEPSSDFNRYAGCRHAPQRLGNADTPLPRAIQIDHVHEFRALLPEPAGLRDGVLREHRLLPVIALHQVDA